MLDASRSPANCLVSDRRPSTMPPSCPSYEGSGLTVTSNVPAARVLMVSVAADGTGAQHQVVHPDVVGPAAEALPADDELDELRVNPVERHPAFLPLVGRVDPVNQRPIRPGGQHVLRPV